MPNVDFYILKHSDPSHRWFFACRLLEKAYAQDCSVFVRVENDQDAQHLNALLWTFQDASFIPHALENQEQAAPIMIGTGDTASAQILLNLSAQIPKHYPQFERVMEIVLNTDAERHQSRAHYRFYREQGCTLKAHNL